MTLKNIKWPSQPQGQNIRSPNKSKSNRPAKPLKWRTILGLVLVYVAFGLDWQWIWGVLTLYWIIPDFFRGVTYFIEPISRKDDLILYWFILITWIGFSVALFFPTTP
jgi:hypothetical protein